MGSRRANGEGTISKRGDGRWCARVSLPNGKRKALYGKTRGEVAEKLTATLKSVQDGVPVPSDVLTVGGFLRTWLDGRTAEVRPTTWARYDSLVRLHAAPALGRLRLARLQPEHLKALYSELLGSMSPRSVQQLHQVLRRALEDAVHWGHVQRNVARLVKAPRPQRKEPRTWTAQVASRFLASVAEDRLYALYAVALKTGMRQGELLGLHWRDVDLDRAFLQVRHSLQWVKGKGGVLFEPKTRRSRRRVRLGQSVVDALRVHRRAQAEERLALGGAWDDHGLVFPNELGRPLEGTNLSRQYKRRVKRAGLPIIRFHDLRHSCATILLTQGVHPKVVSELLGHSSIVVTLDTYSHVLEDMQQSAVDAMETALGG